VRAGGARKPSAASQVALLVQALQNGDADMLDQVLGVQLPLPLSPNPNSNPNPNPSSNANPQS